MKTEIRLATQTDFDQVGIIFMEENRYHAELVPEIIQVADPIMTQKWYSEVLNNRNKVLFLADVGSNIIGVTLAEIRMNIDDTIFTPRKYVHINDISVAVSHRGQGIGQLLMERVPDKWACRTNYSDIELQVWERNTQAIGFYEKNRIPALAANNAVPLLTMRMKNEHRKP